MVEAVIVVVCMEEVVVVSVVLMVAVVVVSNSITIPNDTHLHNRFAFQQFNRKRRRRHQVIRAGTKL